MKNLLQVGLLFSLLWCSLTAQENGKNPLLGRKATTIQDFTPNLAWVNPVSNPVLTSFNNLKGNIVVLEFSAVWCGPCIASIPHLNDIQTKFGSVGLKVISIFSPDNQPPLEELIEEHGMTYDVARDTKNELFEGFKIRSFPQVFVLDFEGTVAWHGHPMELDDPYLISLLLSKKDIGTTTEVLKAKDQIIDGEFLAAKETLQNVLNTDTGKIQLLRFINELAKGAAKVFPDFNQLRGKERFAYLDLYEQAKAQFGDSKAFDAIKTNIKTLQTDPAFKEEYARYQAEKIAEQAAEEEWNQLIEEVIIPAEERGEDIRKYIPKFKEFLEKHKKTQMVTFVAKLLREKNLIE